MLHKLKNSIKFGIILFGLLFFLNSCEKEDAFVLDQQIDLVVKKKMFNQFNELSSIIEKANTLIQSAARENNNELYDFVVLEEEVLQAITENGVWYTIKIQRDTFNPSFFENLVIRQDTNGVIKAFLIKYFPDADYLNRIQFNPDTYFSGKQKIKEIEPEYVNFSDRTSVSSRGVECFSYTYTYCGWDGGEASVGDACYANPDGGAHIVSETRLICYDTGSEYISDGTEDAVDVNLGTGTSGGSGGTVGDETDNPEDGFDENGEVIISNPIPTKETINIYEAEFNTFIEDFLTPEQQNWINDFENIKQSDEIKLFLAFNNYIDGAKAFAVDFLDITDELPNAKFDRFLELNDLLEINTWALIQDCAQQNGLDIANYQQLYNHTLPTTCTDKLAILGNDFQDQPLNTGNAAVANVDYYGVEITTNPDFNGDGNPDTTAEVFNAYKTNFGTLATGSKDNFHFSCNAPWITGIGNTANVGWVFSPYFANDITLWNSSNPLTTIFKIDAWADGFPFNTIADDGAIMISAYTSQYWIGSTIQTPFSGTQPFSGNRQWGYIVNQNGKLELYARAVDVARVSSLVNMLPTSNDSSDDCQEDTYYNIGEATWSNLQEQIKQWIIDNGGQAEVVPKTAIRFDKSKLKEVLESNETIDQIPCN